MTKILGISLRTSIGAHQWFGRTAVAEILLHTIISINNSQPWKWTGINKSGIAVYLHWLPRGELSLIKEMIGELYYRINPSSFVPSRKEVLLRMVS
jgi:hypothetical protein